MYGLRNDTLTIRVRLSNFLGLIVYFWKKTSGSFSMIFSFGCRGNMGCYFIRVNLYVFPYRSFSTAQLAKEAHAFLLNL